MASYNPIPFDLTGYTMQDVADSLGLPLAGSTAQSLFDNRPNKAGNPTPSCNPSINGNTLRGWQGYSLTVGEIWGDWYFINNYRCNGFAQQRQQQRDSNLGNHQYQWITIELNSPSCGGGTFVPIEFKIISIPSDSSDAKCDITLDTNDGQRTINLDWSINKSIVVPNVRYGSIPVSVFSQKRVDSGGYTLTTETIYPFQFTDPLVEIRIL